MIHYYVYTGCIYRLIRAHTTEVILTSLNKHHYLFPYSDLNPVLGKAVEFFHISTGSIFFSLYLKFKIY